MCGVVWCGVLRMRRCGGEYCSVPVWEKHQYRKIKEGYKHEVSTGLGYNQYVGRTKSGGTRGQETMQQENRNDHTQWQAGALFHLP